MSKDFEMRLIETSTADGEISAKALSGIASALQELATRVGRNALNASGPGRTNRFMEQFAQLRLRGIAAGSTVLSFSKGPSDVLEFDLPVEQQADDQFWEVLTAVGEDQRPEWVTDLIADSAGRLVEALQTAAKRTVLRRESGKDLVIESAKVHSETWTSKRQRTDSITSAQGRLEKVDLRSHEFRVRDDVGNSVELKHVDDDIHAAQLVGQWVAARGYAVLSSGRLVALEEVVIEQVSDPGGAYMEHQVVELAEILATTPGPDVDGGIEMTDSEFAGFFKAATS